MNLSNLESVLKDEPQYRLAQAKGAVFRDLIEKWDDAKFLPADLRARLAESCPLETRAEFFESKKENVVRALIALNDDLKIESVLMRHADARNTVCVSSQVGCPMACAFCATGKMGFKRNLDKWEIIEQVLVFARFLKGGNSETRNVVFGTLSERDGAREANFQQKISPRVEKTTFRGSETKITNVVFMGMGEPFLNYDNVMGAIKILNDKDGFNLGARSFSISTCGIIEGIEKLANEKTGINLAISLHAPNDALRSRLMPVNKKYPLEKVLRAVDDYVEKTRRKVMLEYVMIKDVNDSDENARELAKIAKRPLCFVNLINYNPIVSNDRTSDVMSLNFKPSSPERVKKFAEILDRAGVQYTVRYRFGRDVKAACGQLAGK